MQILKLGLLHLSVSQFTSTFAAFFPHCPHLQPPFLSNTSSSLICLHLPHLLLFFFCLCPCSSLVPGATKPLTPCVQFTPLPPRRTRVVNNRSRSSFFLFLVLYIHIHARSPEQKKRRKRIRPTGVFDVHKPVAPVHRTQLTHIDGRGEGGKRKQEERKLTVIVLIPKMYIFQIHYWGEKHCHWLVLHIAVRK